MDPQGISDNGVPGPGSYYAKPNYPVPGFKIVPKTEMMKDEMDNDRVQNEPVGPQKYEPYNPAHTSTNVKFGTGTRDGLKQKFFTPAPNNYIMRSDFDTAVEKP